MVSKIAGKKVLILLVVILAITAFLRLWQIDSVPPGLYPDVAINGTDALSALHSGDFKVFYLDNNGREGLFINLIAFSFAIFGVHFWSLRVVGAIIGILTVLGLYLLTKELFFGEENTENQAGKKIFGLSRHEFIALLSSFFLATSFWHINFSRIGFRAILTPFFLIFSFYFLIRAFRTKNPFHFVIAGLFFGFGFYSYIAFRAAPLILAIFIIVELLRYFSENRPKFSVKWWWQKMYLQDGWWKLDIFLIVAIIIMLPIGFYFISHPNDFISRAGGVSVFAVENPIRTFFTSFGKAMAMFNIHGDDNWRHNFSGAPELAMIPGLLFLAGFVLMLKNLFKAARALNFKAIQIPLLIFSMFFVMILPAVLTYEGIPHSLRSIGVIPAVYILAGIGGWWILEKFNSVLMGRKILLVGAVIILVGLIPNAFYQYFIRWAQNPEVKGAFNQNFVDMGLYLKSLPASTQKYVIVNEGGVLVKGIPMPAQTIMFVNETDKSGSPINYLLPDEIGKIETGGMDTVILPMRYDGNLFDNLRNKFPNGQIEKSNDSSLYRVMSLTK